MTISRLAMTSPAARQRNNRRDRRKAKQSEYRREPKQSKKVGHQQGQHRGK